MKKQRLKHYTYAITEQPSCRIEINAGTETAQQIMEAAMEDYPLKHNIIKRSGK